MPLSRMFVSLAALFFAAAAGAAIPPLGPRPGGPPPGVSFPDENGECMPLLHTERALSLACSADLERLDVAPRTRAELEEKRFKLRTKVIRGQADVRILEMELARLLAVRPFDPKAAKKKLSEISNKVEELKLGHLEFLSELAAVLTDAQWAQLQAPSPEAQPGMRPGFPPVGRMPFSHPAMKPECRPMPPPSPPSPAPGGEEK